MTKGERSVGRLKRCETDDIVGAIGTNKDEDIKEQRSEGGGGEALTCIERTHPRTEQNGIN